MITRLERYQGCLIGLAVGDAVGTTVEFKRPGSFEPVTDMTGGGPFRLKAGEWTDDTSMALCLAESLIKCQDFNPTDQMDRYVRWWDKGYLSSNGRCFDIGNTTSVALSRYQATCEPYAGSTNARDAGNGSLMRLAPVPMFFASNLKKAMHMSGESSRTTHGAITCVDACRFFGSLIVGALNGETKEELLSSRLPFCKEIEEVQAGSYKRKQPPEIVGSGYVVKSLEAALWAFYSSDNFKDGCLLAVNLGDDADTTAAIYGQIAGAYYGLEAIPIGWREKLAHYSLIDGMAKALCNK